MSTVEERYRQGKELRKRVPRSSHAEFTRRPDVDPVKILTDQDEGRIPSLIPVRHARMGENAFAFYRAGAKLMATDLASTPTTNIMAQLSGDAHLSNFGWYGSPERSLVFDANDFDETLPGSFEWDVKRLAASLVIAGINNGFDADDQGAVARAAVAAYRDAMLSFASRGYLDVWYLNLSSDKLYGFLRQQGKKKKAKQLAKRAEKARGKDSEHALKKLGEVVGGEMRIKSDPPWVISLHEMWPDMEPEAIMARLAHSFERYVQTLPDYLKVLIGRYEVLDAALKVVGVGSVGTRCYIALLQGRDQQDPLFLQFKEAGDSALADFFPPSRYDHAGQRVVAGQRLMQSATDIFLGWTSSELGYDFYVRQLKDMKYSIDVDELGPKDLGRYARACAAVLAQAHARSGSAAEIAGYIGSGDVFPDAVTEFGVAYAAQNDADFRAFEDRVGFPDEGEVSTTAKAPSTSEDRTPAS